MWKRRSPTWKARAGARLERVRETLTFNRTCPFGFAQGRLSRHNRFAWPLPLVADLLEALASARRMGVNVGKESRG